MVASCNKQVATLAQVGPQPESAADYKRMAPIVNGLFLTLTPEFQSHAGTNPQTLTAVTFDTDIRHLQKVHTHRMREPRVNLRYKTNNISRELIRGAHWRIILHARNQYFRLAKKP